LEKKGKKIEERPDGQQHIVQRAKSKPRLCETIENDTFRRD
jgi:hypothetical protein